MVAAGRMTRKVREVLAMAIALSGCGQRCPRTHRDGVVRVCQRCDLRIIALLAGGEAREWRAAPASWSGARSDFACSCARRWVLSWPARENLPPGPERRMGHGH